MRGRPATFIDIPLCPLCLRHVKQCSCPPNVKPPKIRKTAKHSVKSEAWQIEPYYWQSVK